MERKEKIIDINTGEIAWRNYTDAENAEVELAEIQAEAQAAAYNEAEAAKAAAQAKLAALGLTADDLRALGL